MLQCRGSMWAAGFEGAGKEMPVAGTGARVRDVKKFTKSSQRLVGRCDNSKLKLR